MEKKVSTCGSIKSEGSNAQYIHCIISTPNHPRPRSDHVHARMVACRKCGTWLCMEAPPNLARAIRYIASVRYKVPQPTRQIHSAQIHYSATTASAVEEAFTCIAVPYSACVGKIKCAEPRTRGTIHLACEHRGVSGGQIRALAIDLRRRAEWL